MRSTAPGALAAVLAVLLAGCTEPAFTLGGSVTAERPEGALDELAQIADDHGGETVILESYPEQFRITGLTEAGCYAVRSELATKSWIQGLGDCRPA